MADVSKKKFCPCCRLILAAARSIEGVAEVEASENPTITIRKLTINVYHRHKTDDIFTHKEKPSHKVLSHHVENPVAVCVDTSHWKPLNSSTAVGTIIRADSTNNSVHNDSTCPNSNPNYFVRGRIRPAQVDIDLIKRWMQSCESDHKECQIALSHDTDVGGKRIRLIDVKEERIVSASLEEDYVALSYVWGESTLPLLTRRTLSKYTSLGGLKHSPMHRAASHIQAVLRELGKQYLYMLDMVPQSMHRTFSRLRALHGLGSPSVPQTIADAMRFVRNIGKRYLWVDSLCILQDDEGDKQEQLPIMDRIYSQAQLVIIAAAGCDAHSGIPGVGVTKRSTQQCCETINGIDFLTAQPEVQEALDWTAWKQRGWTFQEAMVARRALVFTDDLVYWNCRVDTWREDMNGESFGCGFKVILTDHNSIWGGLIEGENLEREYVCRTAIYSQQVVEFTKRDFKDRRDALWAFIGILKLQAPSFPRGFIWGLPYERLDATLLWSEATRCSSVHTRNVHHVMMQGSNTYSIPYPSWSWLSTTTQVTFKHPCGDSIDSEVTWHEPFRLGEDNRAVATYLKSTTGSKDCMRHDDDQKPRVDWLSGVDIMDFGLLHFTAHTSQLYLKRQCNRSDNPNEGTDAQVPNSAPMSQASELNILSKLQGPANSSGELDDNDTEEDADMTSDDSPGDKWAMATLSIPDGASIADMEVPVTFFQGKAERLGEIIVLSSNALVRWDDACVRISGGLDCGTVRHVENCKHKESYNVMLIEWAEGIAYRRALGVVKTEAWQNVETLEKEIILG